MNEPQMNADERRLNEITEMVMGCAYPVSNELGTGYLEKVYENAMFAELTMSGLRAQQQQPVLVKYRGIVVGEYIADVIRQPDCACACSSTLGEAESKSNDSSAIFS